MQKNNRISSKELSLKVVPNVIKKQLLRFQKELYCNCNYNKDENKVFTFNSIIRFSHCDPAGVIYFPKIFELAHEAYEDFLLSNEMGIDFFVSREYALPVVKAETRFDAPLKLHDEFSVILQILDVRTNSFEVEYRFFSYDNQLMAVVKTVHVCISRKGRNKLELPEELKTYLTEHLVKNNS